MPSSRPFTQRLVVVLLGSVLAACASPMNPFANEYTMQSVEQSIDAEVYGQAAERLRRCAAKKENADHAICSERLRSLAKSGHSISEALSEEGRMADARKDEARRRLELIRRAEELRSSTDPWDKFLLFSELSAGGIAPLVADEPSSVLKEAFLGFGDCAQNADPSCMGMYGELIIRGAGEIEGAAFNEARRKALYWLNLAARYGYEPARRALIAEGENIPPPDLAMEQLQKEANVIAKDAVVAQEQINRTQSAQYYELVRAVRRQNEQRIWSQLFPKMVNCTSNTMGSNTYTSCW